MTDAMFSGMFEPEREREAGGDMFVPADDDEGVSGEELIELFLSDAPAKADDTFVVDPWDQEDPWS